MSAWPGLTACCWSTRPALRRRAASAAMMAAACAARRSPSALNGMSGAMSPLATAVSSFATRAMTAVQSSPSCLAEQPHGRVPGIVLALRASSANRSPTAAAPRPACRGRRQDAPSAVSTVITRSSALTARCAIRRNPSNGGGKILDRRDCLLALFSFLQIGTRAGRLEGSRTTRRVQQTAASSSSRSIERRGSLTCSGLPAHTNADLEAGHLAKPLASSAPPYLCGARR